MGTALTKLVGIRYPIVQTGMAWVAGPRLASAVANAGALGVLSAAAMSTDQLAHAIDEVRARTDAPFGVCLVNLLADVAEARPRARLLVERGVRVASFVMPPARDVVDLLKDAGIAVIPVVGSRHDAEQAVAWGADAVIVEGSEGGGHTGEAASTVLLPQVVDAVSVPVIAAGGFHDGRGLVAALAYGAAGIAMGTRFLLTRDCAVPETVKEQYLSATLAEMTVTRAFDGFPHRALITGSRGTDERTAPRGQLLDTIRQIVVRSSDTGQGPMRVLRTAQRLRRRQGLEWQSALRAARTPALIKASLEDTGARHRALVCGQAAGVIEDLPSCSELVARITAEARVVTARLPR
ncbi:nitronate monooxygenase family protein [Streptomyces sp. BK340]|uniref:NAD(P)H-dependent flavin oxidoreductase n=1 Tax=Streptomyces sp. BK340 TaxID=2572903 RepID=UPI0011A28C82|nr:nitronate monooxygenase [Streptomyces sp. BK340]